MSAQRDGAQPEEHSGLQATVSSGLATVAPLTSAPAIPRVALRLDEAAAALGLRIDSFRRHVLPDLRVVEVSPRITLVTVRELERWAERHQAIWAGPQRA